MEFSTHYLLMADHTMLQKLVMSRIKPLGLTTDSQKCWTSCRDHDGAMQKDIAKGLPYRAVLAFYHPRGMERAGLLEQHTRRKPPYGVCPSDRPRPGAVPPLECYLCSRRRGAARLLTAGDAAGTDPARAYLSQSKQLKRG